MKPSRSNPFQFIFSSLSIIPSYQHQPFSSSTPTRWNSPTNVIITHPTLLTLENCTSMSQLKQIQANMTRTGLLTHTFPASRVLAFSALADTGDIDHAGVLFAQLENPNTYMWNIMIRGYTKVGMPVIGFSFFRRMVEVGVEMDCRSFVFALKACERLSAVFEGGLVHCTIWKMGFVWDLLVRNGMVRFYSVVGGLGLACQVFDESPQRDVVSWTSMIDGYSVHGCYDKALAVFDAMLLSEVQPNDVTLIAVLSACSKKGDLRLGRRIHEFVRNSGGNCGVNLMNAFLDMYLKCGCMVFAREVFNGMRHKDVFSWTSMVNGYAKSGELELARKLFIEMPGRNVVSWNAMIAGYSQNNRPKEALELFQNMVDDGLVPTTETLVCVLSACGQLGCLDFGQWVHLHYIERNQVLSDVIIGNALIDMYAKCGIIDMAARVFNDMPKRNLVSWNSIISAYATHSNARNALEHFDQMRSEGFEPDDITLVGVLSACSHGGLVDEGREYFQKMKENYGLEPKEQHYACMIDLFARVGLVQDAYELVTQMPIEPCKAAWGALLNACRIYGNSELAELAACKIIGLDPHDSGVYVLLAMTCANGRRWDDVGTIRSVMRLNGVKKMPGHSLIEVDGVFHEFLACDKSHPRSECIYKALDMIYLLAKLDCDVMLSFGLSNPFWSVHCNNCLYEMP